MSVGVDRRERRRDRILPDQHGAWGFLLLPVALGTAAAGWSWSLLPVAGAWIAAYPLMWALTGRLTAPRRRERFDRALRIWTVIAVPLMVGALGLRPWLAWVGLTYLIPVAINLWFARARRERDLRNDLVLVAECTLAVPVVAGVAASRGGWIPPWPAMISADVVLMALVCTLTLIGSTLHVKSLIRERANPAFRTAARIFSVAAIPAIFVASLAAGHSVWLAAPFVALSLRAWFLHDPSWRPSSIGLIELGGFVLVAGSAIVSLTG
jgi:hypothetical protein